jgi:hypothetical protein
LFEMPMTSMIFAIGDDMQSLEQLFIYAVPKKQIEYRLHRQATFGMRLVANWVLAKLLSWPVASCVP